MKLNKKYITIFVEFVENENAFRIYGENYETKKHYWLPGLSHEKNEIPDGIKTIAENLLN